MTVLCMLCYRWIITESNDARSSGNSEVWEGIMEKLKNVRAMLNEDFIAIQRNMEDEDNWEKIRNTTLKEIQQQERELNEIAELENMIGRRESERIELVQELEELVKKLTSDVPELGFTANDGLISFSTKRCNMQSVLQQKRNHLQM